MMQHAVIYDCEFMTNEEGFKRSFCGPYDPEPTVVQIGAVKIALTDGLPIVDKKTVYIIPRSRRGERLALGSYFINLTGITEQDIDDHGVSLKTALNTLDKFSEGCTLWAWGHDERNMIALSCFVENIPMPIPSTRFDNAACILLKAGMPLEDILKTNSGRLAAYYDLEDAKDIQEHDGLSDALSITYAMQHLNKRGQLEAEWLLNPTYFV